MDIEFENKCTRPVHVRHPRNYFLYILLVLVVFSVSMYVSTASAFNSNIVAYVLDSREVMCNNICSSIARYISDQNNDNQTKHITQDDSINKKVYSGDIENQANVDNPSNINYQEHQQNIFHAIGKWTEGYNKHGFDWAGFELILRAGTYNGKKKVKLELAAQVDGLLFEGKINQHPNLFILAKGQERTLVFSVKTRNEKKMSKAWFCNLECSDVEAEEDIEISSQMSFYFADDDQYNIQFQKGLMLWEGANTESRDTNSSFSITSTEQNFENKLDSDFETAWKKSEGK